MRIIAGELRGRKLAAPKGDATRPTADRARETLFAMLTSRLGDFEGLQVADLFAGSGALGLEALSRGAGSATLVESDAEAVVVLRANVEHLGLSAAYVLAQPVERFLAGGADSAAEQPRYDLVLLDPPYELALEPVLEQLHPWLAPDAVVVAERRTRRSTFAWPEGYARVRERTYGEATLWYATALLASSP